MNPEVEHHCRVFRNAALVLGLLGLAGSALGAFYDARQFFLSYLFGLLFWLGLALGCLTITMIHYLTGGRWGYFIRRFLEAGFSTLPMMLLLFVPIFFGLSQLYPWAGTGAAQDEVLRKRIPYMDTPWFIVRALFCLLLWSAMGWLLRRWSLEQDRTTDPRPSVKLRKLSGIGVLLYPLTATFVYVDWVMSLEKEWYSTIFAIIILSGQVLSAFAFATILLKIFKQPFEPPLKKVAFHQLGNLLLTFVLFWTYVSFGQLLIIYSGNLPHEISWYRHRIAGSWQSIVAAIALFHFFLPFILLLFRATKTRSGILTTIAGALLLIHIVAIYWMVSPSLHQTGPALSWLDFAAPLGVGGLWVGVFLWALLRAPLLPMNDPRMEEELAYGTK